MIDQLTADEHYGSLLQDPKPDRAKNGKACYKYAVYCLRGDVNTEN